MPDDNLAAAELLHLFVSMEHVGPNGDEPHLVNVQRPRLRRQARAVDGAANVRTILETAAQLAPSAVQGVGKRCRRTDALLGED